MNLPWQSADRYFVLIASLVGSEFCPHMLVKCSLFPIRDDYTDRMAHVVLSLISCNQNEPGQQSTGSKAAHLSLE